MSRMNDPQMGEQGGGNPGAGSATGQLRDQASQVANNLRDMGSSVRDAATEQYEHLRDTAMDYYDQGREKAQQWTQDLEGYVREQPIKSVMIAAGIGLLLGILWRRS